MSQASLDTSADERPHVKLQSDSGVLLGKVAIVTGAGRGIGRAIAIALATAGADVILTARNSDQINDTAHVIREKGRLAHPHLCDLKDSEQINNFLIDVSQMAEVDILVNCAGVNVPEPFLTVPVRNFDHIMSVNVRATFLLSQVVATQMVKRRCGGSIINVTSQMGHVGAVDRSVYCASKHAVEGLTKALAVELGPHQIRVNSVAPTFVETDMTRGYLSEFGGSVLSEIPLGRLGSPEDVAAAVTFLANPAAALITGTSIRVDGGWTAH